MKRETPRRRRRTVRAKSARKRSAAVGRRRRNANTAVIGLADVQVRKRILPGLALQKSWTTRFWFYSLSF